MGHSIERLNILWENTPQQSSPVHTGSLGKESTLGQRWGRDETISCNFHTNMIFTQICQFHGQIHTWIDVPVEQIVLFIRVELPLEVRAAHPWVGAVAQVVCPGGLGVAGQVGHGAQVGPREGQALWQPGR